MKLYLDDFRTPDNDEFIIVRSYQDAVEFVCKNGIPNYISFEYYLGYDNEGIALPSGYLFAKWLVEMDIEGVYCFPKEFNFKVHSSNLIGRNKINSLLNNYLVFNTKIYHKDIK